VKGKFTEGIRFSMAFRSRVETTTLAEPARRIPGKGEASVVKDEMKRGGEWTSQG